jgi:hypothetical protein
MASRRFVIGTLAGTAAFAMLANQFAGAQQAGRGAQRRRILVLDVIETMLEIKALGRISCGHSATGRFLTNGLRTSCCTRTSPP